MSFGPHVDGILDTAAVIRLTITPVGIIQFGAVHPHERTALPLPVQSYPKAAFLVTIMAKCGEDPFMLGRVLDDGQCASEIFSLGLRRRPAFRREQIVIMPVGWIGDGAGDDFGA